MLGLIVVLVVLAIPAAYLVRRFTQGHDAAPGGSDGTQVFGSQESDQAPS